MKLKNSFYENRMKIISILALTVLSPFSINHFAQGHYDLGFFSLFVIIPFVMTLFFASKKESHHREVPTYVVFLSIIIFLLGPLYYQGAVAIYWYYPAILFLYSINFPFVIIINVVFAATILIISWDELNYNVLMSVMWSFVAFGLICAIPLRDIITRQKKLVEHSYTDALTGLLNRRKLDEYLHNAIEQNRRAAVNMTIAMLDIDHFKKVNDTLGHQIGDEVLKDLAKIFKKRCRQVDKIFRLGGEEFLILFYNTNKENAIHAVEKIRALIESHQTVPNLTVTVSIGIAELEINENVQSWLKRSDDNLYRAKERGRNRIESE